jgi:hypothetical protein
MNTQAGEAPATIVRAPHPPLTEYYEREEDRRSCVGEQLTKTASD